MRVQAQPAEVEKIVEVDLPVAFGVVRYGQDTTSKFTGETWVILVKERLCTNVVGCLYWFTKQFLVVEVAYLISFVNEILDGLFVHL